MERSKLREYMRRQVEAVRKHQEYLATSHKRTVTFDEAVDDWVTRGFAEEFRKHESEK